MTRDVERIAMCIVDSQVHIWAAHRPDRPWPKAGSSGRNARPNLPTPLGYPSVLQEMDRAGVLGAFLVPPSWEGDYNDLVLEAVAQHPTRFAIMGRISPEDQSGIRKIKTWKERQGMLGVRVLFEPGSGWPDQGEDHWLWPAAQAAGVCVTIAARGYFDVVARIAARFPDLRISIDHLGADWSKTDSAAFSTLPDVLKLATFPNVAVKASMLPALSSEPYPYRNVQDYLHAAYDAFGPRRLFWGSNLSRLTCTYTQAVTMFTEETPWLSRTELEWVMGRAVCEWAGWDVSKALQPAGIGAGESV